MATTTGLLSNITTPCKCADELEQLGKLIASDQLSVDDTVSSAEGAIKLARSAADCPKECFKCGDWSNALVDLFTQMLDFLVALWRTTNGMNTPRPPTETARSSVAYAGRTNHHCDRRRTVTRSNTTATLGRLALDDEETNLLIQETVRALTSGINSIATEAAKHYFNAAVYLPNGDNRSAQLAQTRDAWQDLADRTYSELAYYDP